MKTPTLFSLIILCAGLFFVSCEETDTPIDEGLEFLSYDAPNRDAPELPGNIYEAGVRFPASLTSPYTQDTLTEVRFFIQETPASCEVNIYTGDGGNAPDSLLYTSNLSGFVSANAWNTHSLTQPLVLSGGELWITIKFSHNTLQRTIGCDPGPAVTNGDWLYDSADGLWIPLSDRSPININWNIRGVVKVE